MTTSRAELILHPVRFRVLQALFDGPQTTQDIAERLPDVAKSSVYRYLRQLAEAELVAVAETRMVRGAREKTYELQAPARLTAEDVAGLTPDEHVRYFTIYVMTLIQDFAAYARSGQAVDMAADRAGYTEAAVYATTEELDRFGAALNEALRPLLANSPGDGRHKHKLAVVTHPLP